MLLLIVACGKEQKSKSKKNREEINEDGLYYGKVIGLNKSLAKGSIKINKIGDSVEVTVKVTGANAPEQFLYEGSFCPGRSEDVGIQSGKRLLAFDQGTHETSYSILLADLNKRAIYFEDRTFIVYDGVEAIGCADIERFWGTPEEDEPHDPPPPRRPRPRPREPEVEPPPPPPPPEEHSSWWERLSDQLRRWWCRVRRRCY